MNWRVKALTQQVFSRIPLGERLNLLMQTKVTRSLPATSTTFDEMRTSAQQHLEAVCAALGVDDPPQLKGYEFGSGWHLGVAVGLAGLGVGSQTLVDRQPLAHEQLIAHTLKVFRAQNPDDPRLRHAVEAPTPRAGLDALGISYRAPVDARETGIGTGTFDFMTSTSTLEHIPGGDLDDLLRECNRILRSGGVFSAMIDYGDHYAAFDPSITRLNFLRYSPRRWRLYSPPFQFQNRLRHSDYLQRVEQAGFDLVAVKSVPVAPDAIEWAERARLDRSFDGYAWDDLVTGDSHVVAVKR